MKDLFIALSLLLSITSCMKEEIPVPALTPGDLMTGSVELMPDYRYQVYFKLQSNEGVSQNLKSEWDLGFECSADGYHVILNTSKLMFAAKTSKTSFDQIADTAGHYAWRTDAASGNLDSTVIGDWRGEDAVWLINRGYDKKGHPLGVVKFSIEGMDGVNYLVSFQEMGSTAVHTVKIPKVDAVNFTFLSLDGGGDVKTLEPVKGEWDLVFTQYTERLLDGSTYVPYLVTGALLNRYQTFWALEKERSFDEIKLKDVASYTFSKDINHPGFNWKTYDFDKGSYQVDPSLIYLIQTSDGTYYKLRFIDFYDSSGQGGNPVFEYQRL